MINKQGEKFEFKCENCGKDVLPVVSGGKHRNHCPYCLYSVHVDDEIPGDRKSGCKGTMRPIGYFLRRTGEAVIVHECVKCKIIRYNRIAGDDDYEKVTDLPKISPKKGKQNLS